MDFQTINDTIRKDTKDCMAALKNRIRELNMKHVSSPANTEPLTQITNKFSNQAGLINRIRFKFKKSGIYVHKGVGRGTRADQVGTTNRKPKEWFNPVIEEYADKIMEHVADQHVQVIFEKLKIK